MTDRERNSSDPQKNISVEGPFAQQQGNDVNKCTQRKSPHQKTESICKGRPKRFKKTIRVLRYLLFLFMLTALFKMGSRFSIMRIPTGYRYFAPGSYVLVDHDINAGRKLHDGDYVLYRTTQQGKFRLGMIVDPTNHSGKSPIPQGYYLLQTDIGRGYRLVSQEAVQARILMTLLRRSDSSG